MITTKITRPCISLHQLSVTRHISINQHPSTTPPATSSTDELTKTTTIPANIQEAKELASYRALETPEFTTLGTPPSVISINSPPSVPVYLRRGSLLSIYGIQEISSIDSVRSNLEFPLFWKRLVYGGFVSGYQKLISTTPFSVLVSSLSRASVGKATPKLFVNLVLDGGADWAVLNKDAIQVYAGNSLSLGLFRLPRYVSKRLARKLRIPGRSLTGLFSWSKIGYTLITGRGNVGLVGNGNVYSLNLNEDEEVLINKNNLLAITVNGPYDLQNCVIKYQFPVKETTSTTPAAKQVIEKPKLLEPNAWGQVVYRVNQVSTWVKNAVKFIQKYTIGARETSYNYLVGNQEFIKVVGPRNLLLQSNVQSAYIPPIRRSSKTIQDSGAEVAATSDKKSSDYLNYVTIEPGKGAVFKSTPDFKEKVKEIERK
ncbi:Altered inheritance of mitochondria protein 24, mitochondrial [Candida viswanathii]|uniref:Altered inheritance of mitochondria protein 24, mitochondrial n=1 Tax=Candida viswanathii TaxID=5486 RepID=A0A367YNU4_9ASCO|nr:Altered inheritance of mitochondria protein 24, mitochondrial [Candida viswanathii]